MSAPIIKPNVRRRRSPRGRIVSGAAAILAAIALTVATWRLFEGGAAALSFAGWHEPGFLGTSALPPLLVAPLFVVSHLHGRVVHYRRCSLWLAWGVFVFFLGVMIPRGVHAVGWYPQPLLILLVTCLFGARPGLLMASLTVAGLLAAAGLTAAGHIEAPPAGTVAGTWLQAGVIGTVVVAMALCGALLHRALDLALSAEEDQMQRMSEAMRALRHRENLLRHAMRVETVGEVSSMVVHQLRNQFQLILGCAAVGMRAADQDARRQFQSIVDTLGQSNGLLENLLGLARGDEGTVRAVDLAEICRQACDSYGRVLPATIALTFEATPGPTPVLLDPQGLEHSLLNLVINARQAIAGEGRIELRVVRQGAWVALSVSDTGHGIHEDQVDLVFKPFFTTKERGKGTGLGLAAVQRFVVSSKGEIEVESGVGHGTTFTLRFPVIDAAVAASESVSITSGNR